MASGKDYTLGLALFPATYGVSTSPQHLSLVCVITVNVHLNRMSWNIRKYAERWSMGLPNNWLCILLLNWNWTIALSQQNSTSSELSSCPWLMKTQKSAYKRKRKSILMFILFGVLGTVCKRTGLYWAQCAKRTGLYWTGQCARGLDWAQYAKRTGLYWAVCKRTGLYWAQCAKRTGLDWAQCARGLGWTVLDWAQCARGPYCRTSGKTTPAKIW